MHTCVHMVSARKTMWKCPMFMETLYRTPSKRTLAEWMCVCVVHLLLRHKNKNDGYSNGTKAEKKKRSEFSCIRCLVRTLFLQYNENSAYSYAFSYAQHIRRMRPKINNIFVVREKWKWNDCKRFHPFPSFYKQFAFLHANRMMVNRILNWKRIPIRKWAFLIIYRYSGRCLARSGSDAWKIVSISTSFIFISNWIDRIDSNKSFTFIVWFKAFFENKAAVKLPYIIFISVGI